MAEIKKLNMKRLAKTIIVGALLIGAFFQNSLKAQCSCNGNFLIETYTSTTNWTNVNKGNIANFGTCQVGGGSCSFEQVRGGVEVRTYRPIKTLPTYSWTAEFTFTLQNPPVGGLVSNGAGHYLAAFTGGTQDPEFSSCNLANACSSCGIGNYPSTNQDGIWVQLVAVNTPGANTDEPYTGLHGAWNFSAVSKKGTVTQSSANIPYPATGVPGTPYYIRLQRTSANQGLLSIFSDAAHTTHITGSPVCFPIDGTITTLDYLQHGVIPIGNCFRILDATVQNMNVCSGVTCPISLSPSFTINPVYCQGSSITANATASSGAPLPPTSYEWLITKCDQYGNVGSNLPLWYNWYMGTPGVFTFPTSLTSTLTCGQYYLVAIAISNCGNAYQPSGQVIYIDCPPTITVNSSINTSPTNTCVGQAVTFTAQGANSYIWSPASGLSSSTGSIVSTAIASVTTVYTVTGTDSYGCSASKSVSVAPGQNIAPRFTLTGTSVPGYT